MPVKQLAPAAQNLNLLPEGFLAFFHKLRKEFEPQRARLLKKRSEVLKAAHQGKLPYYPPPSEATQGNWKISLPEWAQDQRNQITGPADKAKLLVAMCNSNDPGCMPDGEDSITTDWENVRAAQQNTVAAIKGTLTYSDPETGVTKTIKPNKQLMFYRPRGLLLEETRAIKGESASASIFDLGMIFYQTAAERIAAVKTPELQRKLCFYIPKVESAEEAGWWSELIAAMEKEFGIPVGMTKIMYLIESLPAAYEVEEMLYAGRRHSIGFNLGRWDYMASLLHYKLTDPGWILPDRNTIPHDIEFFQNIRVRLVDICHRRGVLAIGGMTALYPDRQNPEINERAAKRLVVDKKNEATIGFDGAWTGHPDQHEGAISQFPKPNQLRVTHPQAPREPNLVPSPKGTGRISLAGTRDALRTLIEYRYGVLSGAGARLIAGYDPQGQLIGGFMEDLATDRIYRLMIAQRLHHQILTEEKIRVTKDLVAGLLNEELAKILTQHERDPQADAVCARYREARRLCEEMVDPALYMLK